VPLQWGQHHSQKRSLGKQTEKYPQVHYSPSIAWVIQHIQTNTRSLPNVYREGTDAYFIIIYSKTHHQAHFPHQTPNISLPDNQQAGKPLQNIEK
jgi:hypothetical protein